jgi:DNA-binding response OmpR family regulator
LSHKQVLIVEDDRGISEALTELLISEGYQVACAYNGEEGIRLLGEYKQSPCLILLDLMMPVKDGYQFRKEQLLDPHHKDVPVVVMSADGNVTEKKGKIGAQDYIRKPVDISTYLKVVKRYCG